MGIASHIEEAQQTIQKSATQVVFLFLPWRQGRTASVLQSTFSTVDALSARFAYGFQLYLYAVYTYVGSF